MPRGKYVNHKGRSRKFTSPEELQNESSSEEESSENEEGAVGTSGASNTKAKPKGKKPTNKSSSDEESEEDSDGEARDAKKGVAGLIEIENPNRAIKKATQKVANVSINDDDDERSSTKPELSRREREQIEKQKARQRYEKLHAEGKTTEAKSDLARLAIIRQQRADAAAKREAEKKALEAKKSGSKE